MQDKKGRELIPETHRVCRRADGSIYGIPAGKKCRKGAEDYTTIYRVKRLNEKRDKISRKLIQYMEKPRPDGIGSRMEHPDDATFRVIDRVEDRVRMIDKRINQLEGRNPNERRWVDGDPYGLARYSNFSSPARRNYENEVISQVLSPGQKGNKAIIVAGGPGAKTLSSSDRRLGASKGFVVIDPSAIKKLDPVVRVGKALGLRNASAMAHTNSSRLAKEIYDAARGKGLNMIIRVTGANPDRQIERVRSLKGAGYRVSVLAYHISPREGIARAIHRFERLGIFHPIRHIRRSHTSIPKVLERISREADNAIMFDVGRGRNLVQYQAGAMVGPISKELQDFRNEFGSPGKPVVSPTPASTVAGTVEARATSPFR